MDLSFPLFVSEQALVVLPADLAALTAGIATRQAASTTAHLQSDLSAAPPQPRPFAPADGAFNGVVAAAIVRWGEA